MVMVTNSIRATDKDRIMAILSDELSYIARQANSSNKQAVEERVATEVMRHMTRNGFTYRHGVTKEELLRYFSDAPINVFAQIVEGAATQEKFVNDISTMMF